MFFYNLDLVKAFDYHICMSLSLYWCFLICVYFFAAWRTLSLRVWKKTTPRLQKIYWLPSSVTIIFRSICQVKIVSVAFKIIRWCLYQKCTQWVRKWGTNFELLDFRFLTLRESASSTGCSLNMVFSKILRYTPDSGLSRFSISVSVCTPDFMLGPPDGSTAAELAELKKITTI